MNQEPLHATDAQVERYVTGATTDPDTQKWLDAHFTDCESCLGRVLDAERIHLGLLEGDHMKRTPFPGCPAEETLQELAAGICPPEIADSTTEHAAHCNYCGPLLSRYLREFAEDLGGEEAALLGQLKSSTPQWQKSFIRKHLVRENSQPGSIFSIVWNGFWPKLATATAAIVAVVGGLFFYLRPDDLSHAQKLVAAAYGERRTISMRLTAVPYAPYKPIGVERAGDAGGAITYQRPSLLRAGAAVGDKLNSSSNLDPRWLQVKARVALLQAAPGSAKEAQGALEKAQAEGLTNPSLQIDLAASYFERAVNEQNPDLSATINSLRAALDNPKISNQERLTALFDLAIAYQKSKMSDVARETWEQYLKLDSSSDWAKEARERLAETPAAPPPKNQSRLESQKPLFFLNHLSDPGTAEHLDIYQDAALRFWLPDTVQQPHGASSQAIHKLAELLEQHDSDSWMEEFLASIRPEDAPAVEALSSAIRANRKGLYELAAEQSKRAAALFALHGNVAGELRSHFESIYASQRFLEGFDCLTQLSSEQAPDRYRWLQIQLALEKYTCSNFGGDFSAIEQGLEANQKKAEESHLHILALRALALEASIKRQQQPGCREVWQQTVQGLGRYWLNDFHSPERLYEFYSILEQCAAQMKFWHAAEALQRHSIVLLEDLNQSGDADLILEGSTHAELAAILAAQKQDTKATLEQNKADSLWNQAGHEPTANTYRLFMRLRLAEIQLKRGDANLALSTLNSARPLLNSTQYKLVSLDFYRILGSASIQLKRLSDAAAAYQNGISVAENSLLSIQKNARDRLRWTKKADEIYRGMTRVLIEQGKSAEAWKLWEWYRSRSMIVGLRTPTPRPGIAGSWQEIHEEIAKIRMPLERHAVYTGFDDGVEAWSVDKTGIQGHWVPIRQEELKTLVNDFAEKCSNQASSLSEIQAEAQRLYVLLLEPVLSELPETNTVVIELDSVLSGLVVPALMDSDGRYVAQIHPVVYSPGILMEVNLRPPSPITANDRILLVDAAEANGTGIVPGHLEERQAAFRSYPQVKLMTGDRATPAEILRELSRSTAFDFVGHGEQRDTHTGLRLNSKVSLTAEDFPPQALAHIKLSILAACSTGTGDEDRLLDTDNLVHSFLSGGVPHVIASQWNVDSAATAQLMQSFHAHFRAGQAVYQAMYEAQKEILMAHNHPYFWAAFSLSGRAN